MNAPINVKNLKIFPMSEEETVTTDAVYGEGISFVNRFMSFTDTPKQNSGSLFGDGAKTHSNVSKDGGELTLNIQKYSADESVNLFDETKEVDGTVSMGKDDVIPYVSAVFEVENDDGTVDLYKYPKLKLTEQAKTVQQKGENGITYSTSELKGDYIFDFKNRKARYRKENLSPVDDVAEIEAWFANGYFEAYSENLKTLTVASVDGEELGTTKITVSPALSGGRSYVYKTDAEITAPTLNAVLNGWAAWDGVSDIEAETGDEICIAEVDAGLKCKGYGITEIKAKS